MSAELNQITNKIKLWSFEHKYSPSETPTSLDPYLTLVLLQVEEDLDVARASSVCRSWRRIIYLSGYFWYQRARNRGWFLGEPNENEADNIQRTEYTMQVTHLQKNRH